jgi:glycosyltransferase involved in cell wall biosynthesis
VQDTSFGEIKGILSQTPNIPGLKRILFFFFLGCFFELKCIASSRAIIVPTTQVREELLKIYQTSVEKVRIIRNGVNFQELNTALDKNQAKKEFGLDPDTALIISTARMVRRKRLDLLIKAVNVMSEEQLGKYRVVIAGDGPERPSLMKLVNDYGLGKIISLPGWLTEEPRNQLYRATDIFVMPSDYESGPITLLEAMACGDASISSKIQGFPILMRQGLDGLLFPAGDFHALSNCLRTLLKNPSMRKQLSISAVHFAKQLSWESVASETLQIYETLLNKNL